MGSICCRSMVMQVGVSLFCPFFCLMLSNNSVVKRTTLPHEKHLTGTGEGETVSASDWRGYRSTQHTNHDEDMLAAVITSESSEMERAKDLTVCLSITSSVTTELSEICDFAILFLLLNQTKGAKTCLE